MKVITNREEGMREKLSEQKLNLYDSLYRLKLKEERRKVNCSCRGQLCRINHARYRWITSKSDIFLKELQTMNFIGTNRLIIRYKCDECGVKFNDKEDSKKHFKTNHKFLLKFHCHKCDERFNRGEDLKHQIEKYHVENIG